MPGAEFQDFLELADKLRQLSDDVDQFATAHIKVLTDEELKACDRSSQALNDAFHILLGSDVDARVKTAKAGLDHLKKITADAQTAIREVKKIDAGVQIAVALGGIAAGILEKDPSSITSAAGDLMAAIQKYGGGTSKG